MRTRHAVDAFHVNVAGSKPHTHLMAVGTVTCEDHAEPIPGAITLRTVGTDGEVCNFHAEMLVIRRAVCPTCHEIVLSITPAHLESALPEGTVGLHTDEPPC